MTGFMVPKSGQTYPTAQGRQLTPPALGEKVPGWQRVKFQLPFKE
jgi:hypothetical protein